MDESMKIELRWHATVNARMKRRWTTTCHAINPCHAVRINGLWSVSVEQRLPSGIMSVVSVAPRPARIVV